jgi:hypothetical protein
MFKMKDNSLPYIKQCRSTFGRPACRWGTKLDGEVVILSWVRLSNIIVNDVSHRWAPLRHNRSGDLMLPVSR